MSPAVGGMRGRSGGGVITSAATSDALVRLSTDSTPSIFASSLVTRAIFVSVAGVNTSAARTPTTATSSLPKRLRVSS
jgi:hypothetical protein